MSQDTYDDNKPHDHCRYWGHRYVKIGTDTVTETTKQAKYDLNKPLTCGVSGWEGYEITGYEVVEHERKVNVYKCKNCGKKTTK